jgi:soluble lytic murein transglycosylase
VALPQVSIVLDDPRLHDARERERAKDWAGAARALEQARPSPSSLAPAEACGWDFVEGRLLGAASDLAGSAAAFDRASIASCPISAYAQLRAAQAYARAGRMEEAVARARAVPDGLAAVDEAKIVLAEALAAKGEPVEAIEIWRALLAASPHMARWVDTAVRLATTLLDGLPAGSDPSGVAQEAYDLATRVVVEAPKLAEPSGATAQRARAVALLRTRDPRFSDALADADRIKLAQAWLDAGEASRAAAEMNALLAAQPKAPLPAPSTPNATRCRAASVRATAAAKAKGMSAADAWSDAIVACAGDDALAAALYSGGKASLAAKRTQEGLDRLATVEQMFPKHRLADDARFHAALAVKDAGDEARFLAMMSSLVGDYPEGDMRSEATFRVALAHLARGDWAKAIAPLDEITAREPSDRHWATSARAAYFRARAAAELGDAADAKARYAQIVKESPLAFYMTQAYARLAAMDATAAVHALDEAVTRDDDRVAFPSVDHVELRAPVVERACRLLEVGEIDEAKRELAAAGTLADGVDAEVAWYIGQLYNRAGAPEVGHALAKGKRNGYLAHYPVGRWRAAWEVAFPRAFEPIVQKESTANRIPMPLTWAIMREESSFYPEAKSPSNAFGLMQLIVPTAKWMAAGTPFGADEASLKRPDVSVALGTKLLATLRGQYAVNPALAISAYNGGGGAVNRWVAQRASADFDLWVELIPWDETRLYTKRVLASQAAYAFLYERSALAEVLTLPRQVSR